MDSTGTDEPYFNNTRKSSQNCPWKNNFINQINQTRCYEIIRQGILPEGKKELDSN